MKANLKIEIKICPGYGMVPVNLLKLWLMRTVESGNSQLFSKYLKKKKIKILF